MSVAIVVVSHSAKVAEGTAEMAGQMAEGARIEFAGGSADGGIGTDVGLIEAAIGRALKAPGVDGVAVFTDLGSAVMTSEMVLEAMDPVRAERVRVVQAPLVEGAVMAASVAGQGGTLDEVVAAVSGADDAPLAVADDAGPGARGGWGVVGAEATVPNAQGLHARPAVKLTKLAKSFEADLRLSGDGENWIDAKSIVKAMALRLKAGSRLRIEGEGPDAREAVDALADLVRRGFGEGGETPESGRRG